MFTLNDNSQSTAADFGTSCTSTVYTFDTPTGGEFAGFYIQDANNGSEITRLAVYYFSPCEVSTAITLDLSNIHGKTKNLFDGVDSTLSFIVTDNTSTADHCPNMIKYLLTFSTVGATLDLIALSGTSANVIFKASSNTGDVKTYTVLISARFSGQKTWLTSASATFTYINPCPTATITATSFPSITTSVLVPASSSTGLWYDSVSGSASS